VPRAEVNGGPWIPNDGDYSRPKSSVNLRCVDVEGGGSPDEENVKGCAKGRMRTPLQLPIDVADGYSGVSRSVQNASLPVVKVKRCHLEDQVCLGSRETHPTVCTLGRLKATLGVLSYQSYIWQEGCEDSTAPASFRASSRTTAITCTRTKPPNSNAQHSSRETACLGR
jgi:hypothetical protein